jgi:hypothetical protein
MRDDMPPTADGGPATAGQVRLEPAAVLALERAQVVDPPLEFLPLLDQGAHGLTVPLLRVALQALRPGPRVAGDLLRLAPGLAEDLVSLPACPAEGLIGFAACVGDGLVGGLLGEGEDTGGRVHVVLGRHARPDRLGPALRLGHHRLGGQHFRLGVCQRGAECRHGRLASAQALSQLRPEFLVLLDQPVQLDLDLIEEGVDLFLVVAGPEPGSTELLVPHVCGRQRHLVSLVRCKSVLWDRT